MSNLRNPVWGENNQSIECEIKLQDDWVPFTARHDDPDAKGQAIYAALLQMEPAPYEPPVVEITARDVNLVRDQKLQRFDHDGHTWQGGIGSLVGLACAAAAASVLTKAQRASDQWHGGDEPYFWITADNQKITMTGDGIIALNLAAVNHRLSTIGAARDIKDAGNIPDDFADLI